MSKSQLFTPFVCVAALLAAGPGHANLLTNGSFEAGTFTPDINGVQQLGFGPGPLPLAGWTLFVGNVFWVGTPNTYGISASDGSLSMSLYDPFDPLVRVGSVQQQVASTVGTRYELSFDVGATAGFPRMQHPAPGHLKQFRNQTEGAGPRLVAVHTQQIAAPVRPESHRAHGNQSAGG